MKHRSKLGLIVLLATCSSPVMADLVSDWDDNTDQGWTLPNLPQGRWEQMNSGGNPDGFIRSIDTQGANPAGPFPYAVAPANWKFDFNDLGSDAVLTFDIRKGWSGFGDDVLIETRVVLAAEDGTLLRGIGLTTPTTSWQTIEIPIQSDAWTATAGEDFESVLSKGVILQFHGELFAGTTEGPFEMGVDNVALHIPEPSSAMLLMLSAGLLRLRRR